MYLYFLLKMGIVQPPMLVYQRVIWRDFLEEEPFAPDNSMNGASVWGRSMGTPFLPWGIRRHGSVELGLSLAELKGVKGVAFVSLMV